MAESEVAMNSSNRFDEAGQIKDGHEVKDKETSGNAKSDSQQAKDMLLESESHYRLLVENANEAICVACDGMLRYVNPKTTEIMGYSSEEMTSTPFARFIHPDDRNMVLEHHVRRLKGEQVPAVYPFRAIDKYGNIKWMEISAALITWEGKPATLNFLTDITERKRVEEALQKSETRYVLLIENANEAVVVICEGRICFSNSKTREITGYSREELISQPFVDLIRLEDTEKAIELYQRTIRNE